MSLTKLSLAANNLFPARESFVSDTPAGDGKIVNLFLQCDVLHMIKDLEHEIMLLLSSSDCGVDAN